MPLMYKRKLISYLEINENTILEYYTGVCGENSVSRSTAVTHTLLYYTSALYLTKNSITFH